MSESDPAREPGDIAALLDWKRRIGELYAEVRRTGGGPAGWQRWQAVRQSLFSEHPQSPVPVAERAGYAGPHVYPHDPAWRALARVEPAPTRRFELPASTGAAMVFTRFALARFVAQGEPATLELYWLEGYGGGLFVPFADATSGVDTYGAGRYVLDTVKGADLGEQDGLLVLDFNFAYQPSCAYDPRWACPLAPSSNRLAVPVRAGERAEPA
jgi:uncharacterized protein (DUF1684 family)